MNNVNVFISFAVSPLLCVAGLNMNWDYNKFLLRGQLSTLIFPSVLVLIATWFSIKVFIFVQRTRRLIEIARKCESGTTPDHWLLGDLTRVWREGVPSIRLSLREESLKGGRIRIRWYPLMQPNFRIIHPDPARDILVTKEPKSRNGSGIYSVMEKWIGNGLLISEGKKWERNRRLLTPAFHFSILKSYFDNYNEAAADFVESIRRHSLESGYVNTPQLAALFTLDVILRCAFSYKDDIQKKGLSHPFVSANIKLAHLVFNQIQKPLPNLIYYFTKRGREFRRLTKYAHEFSQSIIDKHRDYLNNNPGLWHKAHLDFLDILLTARDKNGVGLSNEDIRAEADTFLFEGHDTTASLVTFSLYCLAKYPECQVKVREEVSSVLNGKQFVSLDDLSKLEYTQMFIKEVSRLYPPVPGVSRDLSKPLMIDDILFPAKSRLTVSIAHIHTNSDLWESPLEFIPERFGNDSWIGRHPYMFIPFSAGPRNCIGQNLALHEEKVMLCHIIKNFEINLKPDHEIIILPELVTRSSTGVPLKFTPIT